MKVAIYMRKNRATTKEEEVLIKFLDYVKEEAEKSSMKEMHKIGVDYTEASIKFYLRKLNNENSNPLSPNN
jgi:hypothetical protein